MQSDLFNANQRPAVDVGISVSRVGGDAQPKAMKKVAGTLKLTLAQYRSMAAFAMFASDLDAATRRQLTRGERLMELLKQPQSTPYPLEEQVASIWTGTHGYLDDLEVTDVLAFERALLDHLRANSGVLGEIAATGDLSAQTEDALKAAVEGFHSQWIIAGRGAAELDEGEVEAERVREEITRARPSGAAEAKA